MPSLSGGRSPGQIAWGFFLDRLRRDHDAIYVTPHRSWINLDRFACAHKPPVLDRLPRSRSRDNPVPHPERYIAIYIYDCRVSDRAPRKTGIDPPLPLGRNLVAQNTSLRVEKMTGDRCFTTSETVAYAALAPAVQLDIRV